MQNKINWTTYSRNTYRYVFIYTLYISTEFFRYFIGRYFFFLHSWTPFMRTIHSYFSLYFICAPLFSGRRLFHPITAQINIYGADNGRDSTDLTIILHASIIPLSRPPFVFCYVITLTRGGWRLATIRRAWISIIRLSACFDGCRGQTDNLLVFIRAPSYATSLPV